jgi:hypothetical protein
MLLNMKAVLITKRGLSKHNDAAQTAKHIMQPLWLQVEL